MAAYGVEMVASGTNPYFRSCRYDAVNVSIPVHGIAFFLRASCSITFSSFRFVCSGRCRMNLFSVAKVFSESTLLQDHADGRFCGKSSLHSSSEAYFPQKSCCKLIPNLSSSRNRFHPYRLRYGIKKSQRL